MEAQIPEIRFFLKNQGALEAFRQGRAPSDGIRDSSAVEAYKCTLKNPRKTNGWNLNIHHLEKEKHLHTTKFWVLC